MPTFIKADPNPAIVTIWSVSQQAPLTLSWDTGSNSVSGTVWVNDGVTSTKLNDTSERPMVGAHAQAATRIGLGKKLTYELKPTNNPAQVLASVTVEGREELGLPHGVVLDMGRRFPAMQRIFNLRVLPGVDWVRILFRTSQPTNPIIDITHPETGELVTGAILGQLSSTHDYTFSLPQGTLCRFHILAYSQLAGANPVEEAGLFVTGSRKASVSFDTVLVDADGDPGFYLGAGDLAFHVGAGDIDSGDLLADTRYSDSISDGEFRHLNLNLPLDRAPLRLWVQVRIFENDSGFLTPFGGQLGPQLEAEGAMEWTDDVGECAVLTKWFDLSDAGPVPEEIPFTLATGPKHLDLTFHGRLRVQASPGEVIEANVAKSQKPTSRAKSSAVLVAAEPVAIAGRKTQTVQLGRDGHLYRAEARKRATTRRPAPDPQWTRIARDLREPLTVVGVGDALHLLSLSERGEVLHRALPPDAHGHLRAYDDETSLGGAFAKLVAVAAPHGVELFAQNAEGVVFHSPLGRSAEREWRRIGEGASGSLNAFSTQRGAIGVVVVGRDGELQHAAWPREAGPTSSPTWQPLGRAPDGALSVESFDDVVVLAVLTADESVVAAAWRDYPRAPRALRWHGLGTIDSLTDTHHSLTFATSRDEAAE